ARCSPEVYAMRTRKAFTWAMSSVLLAAIVILAVYLRGAFGPLPSEVYEAAPAPKVIEQEQQSRLAAAAVPAARAPIPQLMEPTQVQEEVEQVDVDPSGAVVGQVVPAEDFSSGPEATGVLPLGTTPVPESPEPAEIQEEVE